MYNYLEESENGLGIKIFISGKITGDPNYLEKFKRAEEWLIKHNFIVLNPATLPLGMTNQDYMSIGFSMINAADWIFMLKDWEDSSGAKIEYEYAKYLGKHIAYDK